MLPSQSGIAKYASQMQNYRVFPGSKVTKDIVDLAIDAGIIFLGCGIRRKHLRGSRISINFHDSITSSFAQISICAGLGSNEYVSQ